ncbi:MULTISPECIES: type II secretion system protein GspM [Legionella]|uniref:type II secretion system protein GspM n=1 Tax=Legionella TaxID=445 RepID=UPI0013152F71|nr:type II secretion system protein M [Legionella septentrionalis]MCP0914191.1 type II secretion system protein M [Legionella sp. 27cVA30]
MKAYWNNLNERERWLLGVGFLVCIFYLFYLLLYSPLVNAIQSKKQQLAEKRETLNWMQQVRQQHKAGGRPAERLNNTQLLTAVANQLNTSDVKSYTHQLQQTANGDVQLSFERVPYAVFIHWLWLLNQKYALTIKQFNAEQNDTPGIVKAVVILSAQ